MNFLGNNRDDLLKENVSPGEYLRQTIRERQEALNALLYKS